MANLLQQYIEQGLEQGLEQGRAEGEIKGKRDAIRTFLHVRFGALPQSVERRVTDAALDELEALLRRAGTVESLSAF